MTLCSKNMNKRNVIIGALVGAVVAICLLALILLAMPYIYLSTENRNFEKLRKKLELDC
jgi:Na+/proline symporter